LRRAQKAERSPAVEALKTTDPSSRSSRWGNRTINQTNTFGNGIPKPDFSVNPNNNQLVVPSGQSGTMTYDSAGNLTIDTHSALAVLRAYDAENRMTKETQTNSYDAGIYSYDGDGRRVKRIVNGGETWQVYGIGGELLAEYPANGAASSPRKEYGYRNGQLLVTLEAASAPAPSGLGASPSNSSVALSWSAASGVTSYRVERKGAGGTFHLLGTTTSTSFTDGSSGNAYLYKVCAADGSNSCTSGYSNVVLGMAVSFTDPTIISFADDPLNATPIKAAHLTELRTAVNAVRSLAGLSAASWTNPTLTPQVTQISADDVRDLRTKLDEALTALGIQTSAYTDPTLATGQYGTQVKRIHITELRQRATSGTGGSGGSGGSGFQIHWLVSDQLGTPRMIFDQSGSLTVTDQNGNYVSGMTRHDYLPFGEELFAGTGGRTSAQGYSASDNVRQKFTLKERDNETGLDYFGARYYASTQGRFTSPDPLPTNTKRAIPQNWNRYTYCGNSPLVRVDPTGLDWGYYDLGNNERSYVWFEGKVGKYKGHQYSAVDFGKSSSKVLTLVGGSQVEIFKNGKSEPLSSRVSPSPGKQTQAERRDDPLPTENRELIRQLAAQPFEKATGAFILVSAAVGTGGGLALSSSAAMTSTTTLAIDSYAVTTRGAASDIAVIGGLEETSPYVAREGFNVLRAAKDVYTWGGVNEPWLDSIIQNGQSVLVKAGGAGTAAEIEYLMNRGYQRVGELLVPPH
jgi:RHS repeat-associated protein